MLAFMYVICALVAILSENLVNGSEFSSDFPKCRWGDTKCLPDMVTYYIKSGASGIPSLALRPIDPLFVETMDIVQGNQRGPVHLRIDLKNVSIAGYSDMKCTKVIGLGKDAQSTKLEFWGAIPRLTITGQYTAKGSVLILPIVGHGVTNFTMDNLDFHGKFLTTVVQRNGQDYLHLNKVIVDFDTTRMYIYMANLFNGDKLLGDTTNQFLNENWRDVFDELRPALLKTIGTMNLGVVKPVFDKVPYAELFENAIAE